MLPGNVVPPSVEYARLTLVMEPVRLQVRFSDVPTVHFSFPLGAVRVKAPRILKLALESSNTVVSAVFVTRTFYMIWLERRPAMSTLSI